MLRLLTVMVRKSRGPVGLNVNDSSPQNGNQKTSFSSSAMQNV